MNKTVSDSRSKETETSANTLAEMIPGFQET
jgi:hypothetical protein